MSDPDRFLGYNDYLDSPARHVVALTPDDDNDLVVYSRSLWVGTGGDVKVTASHDTVACVIPSVPGGSVLPVEVKRLWATGTTASGFVALY